MIDLSLVLAGELYGPLRDVWLSNRLRIDPEVPTLVRPNGGDFDPATLHDWPEHLDSLKALARGWAARAPFDASETPRQT